MPQYCGTTAGARGVWWFDESSGNAADQTANARTLTNNNTVAFAAGNFNNAADFGTANTNKTFSRTDASGYTGGDASISVWVKIRTEPSDTTYEFFNVHESTNSSELRLDYVDTAGTKSIRVARTKRSVITDTATNNVTALGTTAWHHIVFTYNSTSGVGTAYLDGSALANTFTQTGAGTGGCNVTEVGGFSDADCLIGSTYSASAYVDEVVFSSNVWSATDVSDIYNRVDPPIGCPAVTFIPKVMIF